MKSVETILKQVALSDADPHAVQAHLGKSHSVSEVKIQYPNRRDISIFFQNRPFSLEMLLHLPLSMCSFSSQMTRWMNAGLLCWTLTIYWRSVQQTDSASCRSGWTSYFSQTALFWNTAWKWLALGHHQAFCRLIQYSCHVLKLHNLKVFFNLFFTVRRSSTTVLNLPSSPSFLTSFTKSSSCSLCLISNRSVVNLTLQISCGRLEYS